MKSIAGIKPGVLYYFDDNHPTPLQKAPRLDGALLQTMMAREPFLAIELAIADAHFNFIRVLYKDVVGWIYVNEFDVGRLRERK